MSCGARLGDELRSLGYRITPQRSVILETIAHSDGHPSAHEVFEGARRRLPGLNIATVYRTLGTLRQAGVVDLMQAADEPVRCSIHDGRNRHGHLICRACHAVLELAPESLRALAEIAAARHFALDTTHLTLTGLCEGCQKALSSPGSRRS